jgi:hypothetical protein
MDTVAAPDRDRILVLESALFQSGKQPVDIIDENVAGALQLYSETGVEHVRRGHALMDEARIGSDELGQMRQEGDDVVLRLALDLVDAVDVENSRAAFFPDGAGGLLRDHTKFGERIAGMRLDLEPDAETGLGRPDSDHFRPRITRDHEGRRPGWLSLPAS